MNNHRILVADDTPSDLRLTLNVLAEIAPEAEVETCVDGESTFRALSRIAANPELPLPSLVLLDMRMPHMSGLDVLRALEDEPRLATLPVVLFSAWAHDWEVLEATRRGGRSYVPKPVEYDAFFKALQGICRYWLGFNESPDARSASGNPILK